MGSRLEMQSAVDREHAHKLDQKFISPFLHAVKEVLSTMAQLDVAAQPPKLSRKATPFGDIASVMPMSCSLVTGQLTVSFTTPALISIASKMMMEEFNEVEQLVLDSAGELTNMITGSAKAKLETAGYDFDMARPTTYVKSDYGQLSLTGEPRIVVPYHTEEGNFFVDLGFIGSAT